jgi:hypothetical protein
MGTGLTIWTADTQDNDARWKGASWVTRFLGELERSVMGSGGQGIRDGGFGLRNIT